MIKARSTLKLRLLAVGLVWMLVGSLVLGVLPVKSDKTIAGPVHNIDKDTYYWEIQVAIDDADPGNTIEVSAGTYYEKVIINKTLTLIGEDRDTTVIDGGGSGGVVRIEADLVNVSGFGVRNGSEGVYLYYSSNNQIINCICHNNSYAGIYLHYSSNNNIVNCVCHNNSDYGIFLRYSSKNIVAASVLPDNHLGIAIGYSSNNSIRQCVCYNNSLDAINLASSLNNHITDCVCSNNYRGVFLQSSSTNNLITGCVCYNNTVSGIGLCDSSNNSLANCIVYNNSNGTLLYCSSYNMITNSMIHNNSWGTYVYDSSDTYIYHNSFVNNTINAYDECTNYWDNNYPSGGNYWSDYTGEDLYSGVNQYEPGSDGIGDTPYDISGGTNQDRYPLMSPWNVTPNQPPIVNITYPEEGQSVNGTVTISGTASDPDDTVGEPAINLTVYRCGNDINLTWNVLTKQIVSSYRVYKSVKLDGTGFALFTLIAETTANWYVDAGAYADDDNYSYLIKAVEECVEVSTSNIGFKLCKNIYVGANWVSLPSNTSYSKFSDIVDDLAPELISCVRCWDASIQAYITYTSAGIGQNVPITPGMAVCIEANTNFVWKILGSHKDYSLSFIYNTPPAGNINWLSLPYHANYTKASDIVMDIESNLGSGSNTKINTVSLWDPVAQVLLNYTYILPEKSKNAVCWGGVDFAINPGDAIRLNITSSFTWSPLGYPVESQVEAVYIKIDDGTWQLASGTTSWTFEWDTTTVSNGWHTIYARAYDGIDYSEIKSVSVYVDNPVVNQPPIVNITYPEEGQTVNGTVTITGTAYDPDSVGINDTTPPTSSVNIISPYWQNTNPLTITATASDTGHSGLASVELWHRYSADNVTWGGWSLFGTDTAAPWSWSFSFPNGTGYYEFYTRARDNATNYESAPSSPDTLCRYSPGGLTSHAPIYINSNSDFSDGDDDGVSNPSAAGTANDPYIIQNWDIDAHSANGIEIRNTNAYFIIRNCVIHDGTSDYHGIYFYSVTHGKIDNVSSYNNMLGIYIDDSSHYNQITNCALYNNYDGIWLVDSSLRNQIINCAVYNNYYYGIWLYSSHYNNITNCTVYANSKYGIWLDYSSRNQIINCAVYNNYDIGIWLYESSNNNITNCTVYNNLERGIRLGDSSNNNTITNCSVYSNSKKGIYLASSSNNNIHYNNIYDNTGYGVYNWNSASQYTANATYNWWGSADGPGGVGPGSGDAVSSNVLYDPWLTEPVESPKINHRTGFSRQALNGTTVQFVEIKIDSGSWQLATGTTSWTFNWDTTTVPNGWHTIYARACDGIDYSDVVSVDVYVGNPVLLNIDYIIIMDAPGGVGNVTGAKSYSIGSTDTFYACGFNRTTDSWVQDIECTWTSNDTAVGIVTPATGTSTTFTAITLGACKVTATNATLGVSNRTGILTVVGPNQPPIVNITYPEEGQTVNGTVTVTGTAYDPDSLLTNITPQTNSAKARSPGYVVYILTISSNASVDYIDLEAVANVTTGWIVEFLNESGVPYKDTNGNGKPDIAPVVAGIDYYVYVKISIPKSIANGTAQTHTIYINASDGSTNSVTVETMCDILAAVPPHAISGRVEYLNGTPADGAFVLMLNTRTGETAYDIVGPTGVTVASGNYSTDCAACPSGWKNGDIVKVMINDGTYYGVGKLVLDNFTPYQSLNITLNMVGVTESATQKNMFHQSGGVVQFVEIRIDSGSWQPATGTTSWYFDWDTTTVSNGWHTIYARAYDGIDYSEIDSVNVYVDNPTVNQPPIVNITYPTEGQTVNETVTITGCASDPDEIKKDAVDGTYVQKVEVKIDDGFWQLATGTTSWSFEWDTTTVENGWHTIYARAYDGINYSEIKSVSVYVNNIQLLPQVLVLWPNGGETLVVNQDYTIKWALTMGAHQISFIYVDYTYDGGSSWIELAELSNVTSWVWKVNNTPSVNCLVRVRAVDIANNTGADTSNETFAIAGAFVKSITIGNCNVSIGYKGAGTENVTVKNASLPGNIPANLKDIGLFVDITGNITDGYITITYSDDDVAGIDESKLKLYYWNETASSWVIVPESGVWLNNNTVWAKIDHLTVFAPLGEKLADEADGAQPYQPTSQILPVLTYTTIVSVAILITIICIAVVLKRRRRK